MSNYKDSFNHANRLKYAIPSNMTPYILLETLTHLRERGFLEESWKTYEKNIVTAFQKSDVNKEWAWRIEEGQELELFNIWKFNLNCTDTHQKKMDMILQSELAEDELKKIIKGLGDPSDKMLFDVNNMIEATRKEAHSRLQKIIDDMY